MEVMWEKDCERNTRISDVIFDLWLQQKGGGGGWESRQKEWRSEKKEPAEK